MKYNSGLSQIIVVSAIAFCCPGIYNALNGLGGAGNSTGNAASIANATLYACFAVFGYFGGAAFNKLGNKVLMLVGGLTYVFYAVGMYICGRNTHMEWLAAISGAVLGFGAGWFWTSQGAMMMAYGTADTKGKFISIFWVIFNLGGMVGGFIAFGLNYNNAEGGQANPASYFTFVAIMAIGAAGALFLLPPDKVEKADGSMVRFEEAPSFKEEVLGALSVVFHPAMLILTIPFIASNWFYTYQFSGYNLGIFNTRTRGLNSALYWGSQMVGSYVLGLCLDNKRWSRRNRGFVALTVTTIIINLAFAVGCFIQYGYEGTGFERNAPPKMIPIDFKESKRYVLPIFVYLFYGMGDAMFQTYSYWVMASIAGNDTRLCARFAGYYKGVQSAGAAVAWGLDLGIDFKPQFWICWILVIIACPLMFYGNLQINDSMDDAKPDPTNIEFATAKLESSKSLRPINVAPGSEGATTVPPVFVAVATASGNLENETDKSSPA